MGDYSDLEPAPEREGLLAYAKSVGILKEFNAFIVDRPLIYFHEDAKGIGVDPAELEMLSSFLHELLVDAVANSGAFRVVEEPGQGVVRLRTAITDVVPVDPAKNLGPKAVGVALGVGLLVPRLDMGRASVEVEMVDAVSGERLVAIVAARSPSRFGGLVKGSKEWGDVKAAFRAWAKSLRKQLSDIHDTEPSP